MRLSRAELPSALNQTLHTSPGFSRQFAARCFAVVLAAALLLLFAFHAPTHRALIHLAVLLVWTPAVAVIYALPPALQYPIQAVVTCFWSLILVIMTGKK